MQNSDAHIVAENITIAYGDFVVQRDLNFTVSRGDIFIIMGGSGCGKSTLLKTMIGLKEPSTGDIYYDGVPFWSSDTAVSENMKRKFGTLFQSGALWSSMTLAENIGLALKQYTSLSDAEIREVAAYKLMLVGLAGFEDYYPNEISGGMKKRAGLARAMAIDPDILFFDEPSAGLDPISAKLLDDLVSGPVSCCKWRKRHQHGSIVGAVAGPDITKCADACDKRIELSIGQVSYQILYKCCHI